MAIILQHRSQPAPVLHDPRDPMVADRYEPPTAADWERLEELESVRRLADHVGGWKRLAVLVRNLAYCEGLDVTFERPADRCLACGFALSPVARCQRCGRDNS